MPLSIRQHDNADALPPYNGGDPSPYEQPRPPARVDWPAEVARWVGGIVLLLVVYWLVGRDVRDWLGSNEGGLFKALVALVVLAFAVRRLIFIRQPGGYLVAFWQAARMDAERVVLTRLDVERTHAGTSGRLLAQQTYSPTNQYPPQLPPAAIEGEVVEDGPALIPDRDWLAWIDRVPHLMLAGRTDAGKTTFAEALLAQRIQAGDQILICDPHYQPGKWGGLEAVGGGKDFDAILGVFPRVLADMDARYQEFNQGRQTEDFQRLTIFIDEVPAIIEATFRMTPAGAKKITDERWQRFARQLGSQARKVRISVILLTQSIYVEDLMINSAFKENFVRVGLGDKARSILAEEPDNATKRALYELLRGQTHPAALEHNGEVHLLDTASVPALAARRLTHMAQMWQPPQLIEQARPVVSASVRPSATVSAAVSLDSLLATPPPDGRTTDGQRTKLYLKAMAAAGKTREYARDRMTALGMPFENKLWTEVRKELGLGD